MDKPGYVLITKEFIERGSTGPAGWKRAQAELLGLSWPLQRGWKDVVLGTYIPQKVADKFLGLKGMSKATRDGETRYVTITITEEQYKVLLQLLGQLLD